MPSSASRWTPTQTYHKTTTLHEGDCHLRHLHGQLGLDHVKGHHAKPLTKTPCRLFTRHGTDAPVFKQLSIGDASASGIVPSSPTNRVRAMRESVASSMSVPKRARALWQIDVPVRRADASVGSARARLWELSHGPRSNTK